MNSNLWEMTNYTTDVSYIGSQYIYEYDIRKANINVLYELGILDDEYYDKLDKMEREDRQVEIGYMLKHNEGLYDKLADGIKSFRKAFFESNGLEDHNIVSIKNDAIFVTGKVCKNCKFGEKVEFVRKGISTTFIKLPNKVEIYASVDRIDQGVFMNIKGIKDDNYDKHLPMIQFLINCIYFLEIGDYSTGMDHVNEIYDIYTSRQAKIGLYRTFDSTSAFMVKVNDSVYALPELDVNDNVHVPDGYDIRDNLIINTNLEIIRFMYGLFAQHMMTS